MSDDTKKSLAFDLDTNKMKEIIGSSTKGYKEIEKFFNENDFIHEQGSVYNSKNPLTYPNLYELVEKLNKSCPWLKVCFKKFAVTEIGNSYDLSEVIKRTGTISNEKQVEIKKSTSPKKSILNDLKNKKNEIANKSVTNKNTNIKGKDIEL